MRNFARIESGSVVELIEADELPPFHPSLHWEQCPPDARVGWVFDEGSFSAPVVDMAAVRLIKNSEINAARAAANSKTFPHDGREFSCDDMSRSDIDGINGFVALHGCFPTQFPGSWKAVDNSYYLLPDVTSWKAFYASMVAHGAKNFAHAQELKAQLSAATTVEEVAAITW